MAQENPSQVSTPERVRLREGMLTVVLLYTAFASLWILISDKTVEWLFVRPAQITLASTLKGLVFVFVTSVLLYGLMRRMAARTDETPGMVESLRPLALPMGLIGVVLIAMTGAGIALTVIQQKDKEVARLQAIADLKAKQIEDWLDERYDDAHSVQANRAWVELFRRWREGGDTASAKLLQQGIRDFLRYNSLRSALLLDERAEPFWSTEGALSPLDPALRAPLEQAVHSGGVVLYGPYSDGRGRQRLDFMTPLVGVDGRPGLIIVLCADPAKFLFPTLGTWPVPSTSGEALLFRRDGDQVAYLNPLRHQSGTVVPLRVPLSEKDLPAARVLRHEAREGSIVEGFDYRGVPIIGVAHALRGTDWYLAAKMDSTEIYGEIMGDVLRIALAGMMALLLAMTSALVYRRRHELAASLREREIQAEKLRALQLLDAIAEGSADAIFAKDHEGRYLLFNREAARVTGKRSSEVLGRNDTAIFPPEQAALVMANDQQVMAEDCSITFHEDLSTVDGEVNFLATKGPLRDAAGNVVGMFGISRDITALKRAEREREMTVDFLRMVNESGDKETMLRAATAFFLQHSGCEAVGIRQKVGDDYPYCETRGFPAEFVQAESSLCARDPLGEVVRDADGHPMLACMCGNILRGRFDPSKPFFSPNGSFWTNSTTGLLATTTEADRQARTRNRCNGEGYESVALIPLRVGEERIGLLQLNDRRKERFTPEDIALWERLAGYLAVALAKLHAEGSLRASLEEKVALLKEVHHRVKNNLQIVASLLSLQANRTLSREAAEVLLETRSRVRSMALLHEVLYRSGNLARINFAAYVRELCAQLLRSCAPGSARVKLESRVAPIGLPLEQAVPCGLIISELISNALKHGFPGERCGQVVVELQPDDGRQLTLTVQDDGIGLPAGFDPAGGSTLGLKLVANLAGQLGGQLTVVRQSEGAAFRVVFPIPRDTPL